MRNAPKIYLIKNRMDVTVCSLSKIYYLVFLQTEFENDFYTHVSRVSCPTDLFLLYQPSCKIILLKIEKLFFFFFSAEGASLLQGPLLGSSRNAPPH